MSGFEKAKRVVHKIPDEIFYTYECDKCGSEFRLDPNKIHWKTLCDNCRVATRWELTRKKGDEDLLGAVVESIEPETIVFDHDGSMPYGNKFHIKSIKLRTKDNRLINLQPSNEYSFYYLMEGLGV